MPKERGASMMQHTTCTPWQIRPVYRDIQPVFLVYEFMWHIEVHSVTQILSSHTYLIVSGNLILSAGHACHVRNTEVINCRLHDSFQENEQLHKAGRKRSLKTGWRRRRLKGERHGWCWWARSGIAEEFGRGDKLANTIIYIAEVRKLFWAKALIVLFLVHLRVNDYNSELNFSESSIKNDFLNLTNLLLLEVWYCCHQSYFGLS